MRVLTITPGADLAGVSAGIARAFDGHPDITVRSLVGRRNYLAYPQAEPWTEQSVRRASADARGVTHAIDHARNAEVVVRIIRAPGRR